MRSTRLPRIDLQQCVRILAVLMEVLWAYPWLAWIGRWDLLAWERLPLNLGSAVLLCGTSAVITRWALRRQWALALARLAALGLMLFLLAATIRLDQNGGLLPWDPGWVGFLAGNVSLVAAAAAFGAYLLWRGIVVGRDALAFDDLYPRFIFGLIALVALLVVQASPGAAATETEVGTFGLYAVAFFASGLLALAVANLDTIRTELARRQESIGLFNRRWLSLLAGVVVAIVAVSGGIAAIFSLDILALLLHPLNLLANLLLLGAVYVIAYPLGFLVAGLVYALRFLVDLLGGPQRPQVFDPPDFSGLRQAAEGQQPRGIPPEVVLAIKWGLLALVVLIVLLILARALFRYWRGQEDNVEEVSESLWSWDVLKADLVAILSWPFRWWRTRKWALGAESALPVAVARPEDDPRSLDIREIYRGVLWEGAHRGSRRAESDTPFEYARRLEQEAWMDASALRSITEAYVEARYGGKEMGGERLGFLNALWRRFRSGIRGQEQRPAMRDS